MSQQQKYLANALRCAQGAAAGDPEQRLQLQRAEQAWLVLAGIESAPKVEPVAPPADRQGFRAGWFTG